MEYDNDLKKYVPRFYTDEGRGSVLGANVMMGHNIVFDQVNGRLGIAESHCDYVDLVTNMGFSWNPHEVYNKADHLPPAEDESTAEEVNQEEEEEVKDDEGENKLIETPNPMEDKNPSSVSAGFCTNSLTCSGGIFAVLVVGVVAVALIVKSRYSGSSAAIPVSYSSELELAATDDDGEFGQYRDEPAQKGSDESDDNFDDEGVE